MSSAPQLASAEQSTHNTFGILLAETLAEMESAEIMDRVPDDAVERLSLEAHQAVVNQTGRPLPRAGGHIYRTSTVTPPAPTHTVLDVRY